MRKFVQTIFIGFFGFWIIGTLLPEPDPAPVKATTTAVQSNKIGTQTAQKTTSNNAAANKSTSDNPPYAEDKKQVFQQPATNVAVSKSQRSATQIPDYAFVTATRLNLRSNPDTNARILSKLPNAQQVIVLSRRDGWANVTTSLRGQSVKGWVSSKYLSLKAPAIQKIAKSQPKRQVAVPSSREITAAKKEIIRQSLASYPGNCPCPYFRDRAGRSCGKRSAWSKPGGYSPMCYESDITETRLATYFARTRGIAN